MIKNCYVFEPFDLKTTTNVERYDLKALYQNIYKALQELEIPYAIDDSRELYSKLKNNELPFSLSPDIIYFSAHSHFVLPNVWNIKKSYLRNYAYFDRTGYSGWAEVAINQTLWLKSQLYNHYDAESAFIDLHREFVQGNITKWRQKHSSYTGPDRFVFVPMQLIDDTVMQLSWHDPIDFYMQCVKTCKEKDLSLVLKRHPKCSSSSVTAFLDRVSGLPWVHVSDANIHDLLSKALCVVAINSGAAFEALLHKKRVYLGGDSDYHWITHSIKELSQLSLIDTKQLSEKEQIVLVKFMAWFCNDYLVRTDNFQCVLNKIRTAVTEFTPITTTTIAGAQQRAAADRFSRWRG